MLSEINHHPRDTDIQFDEGPHVYTVKGKKNNISVTTMVHQCFPHFDSDKISNMIINNQKKMSDPEYKYYGYTKEQIEAEWKANGERASSAGTKMHADIEYFYNKLPVENTSPEYALFQQFVKDYPELQAYRTEWTVYYEEIHLAGSIDMVFYNTETKQHEIYDWKRVLNIEYEPLKKTDVGYAPLDDVPNTNFWHYTLQLNIYKKMLQDKYGLTIGRMFLIVLHPDNVYKTYLRLEVPDFQDKVQLLFDHRKKQLEQEPITSIV